MSRRHASLLVILLAAVFGVTNPARAQGNAVKWRYNYIAARKEAQEKNLPMVLDFGTATCVYCKKLDDTTFADATVAGVMNERFIPLKIDADVEVRLTQDLRIQQFPTLVFATPDGKILGTIVGYQDAATFHETLQRTLASLTPPEWMLRDYAQAVKWIGDADYPPAIAALRRITEDGKGRPIQVSAQKVLATLEAKARERLNQAAALQDQGKSVDASQLLTEIIRDYPGLALTREAADILARLAATPEIRNEQRSRRALELLAQAREYHKNKDYTLCVDRCTVLMRSYGDLAAGQQASALFAEIKNNPEWLQNACNSFGDRLAEMYLALAESLLKRGQPQQARHWLERVIRAFPGSQQAESAQIRLEQLQGAPVRRADFPVEAVSSKQ